MSPRIPVEIVRAACVDDVRAITSLYPTKSASEREEMMQRHLLPELRGQERDERTILLARWNDRVVGTVQVVWHDADHPILWAPGTSIIHHLRTHPDLQGRGVGTQLVDAAAHVATSRGMVRLTLGVEPENHRARRFYEMLGFEEYGRYEGETGEPLLAMQYHLVRS